MDAVTIEESDDERSIVTPNCRLSFHRLGERWTHGIQVGPPTDRSIFAEAEEADPDRDDFRRIPSPSFQDLHFQSRGDSVIAMLVGQFGPRHFSATFSVRWYAHDPSVVTRGRDACDATGIEVDLADRSRQAAEFLSASYAIFAPASPSASRSEWECVWSEWGSRWRFRGDSWNGDIGASLNRSDAPGGSVLVADAGPGRSHLRIARTLLPFQANGRLPFAWSVRTPWAGGMPTTP